MDKEKTSRIIEDRKEKLEDLKNQNINLYPNRYTVSHTIGEVRETIENSSDPITEEASLFIVAGRIMAINRFGKTSFLRFRDRTGQLQAYLRKDRLGNESYQLFKQLDVGDFVGLKGGVFQTKTGEWTLLVNELNLLCKSIKTLPEKIPWAERSRKAISATVYRSDHESERSGYFFEAKPDDSINTKFFSGSGFSRS
jgi:lysyl-tRNA synthetase class 2